MSHRHKHRELTEAHGHSEQERGCACGHDHEHGHSEQERGCACGHDHEHGHSEQGRGCACGHDHEHGRESAKGHPPDCQCETCVLLRSVGCGCSHCQITPADSGPEQEERASKRDILLLGAATVLFLASLLLPHVIPAFTGIWRLPAFAVSALLAGRLLFWNGLKQLVRFRFDESVLLLIAVVASFILGEYPEACLVTILFQLGAWIETAAIRRSKKSMQALTAIRPDYAFVKTADGDFASRPAGDIEVGAEIWLRAGDKAALDCEVTEGGSSVDASALTGEAVPQSVGPGDTILSGSVNLSGTLRCRSVKSFENSTASQILSLVYDSMKKKGKTEAFITRFARAYTPAVISIAVLIAIFPPLFGWGSWSDFIFRGVFFLMASCPCALVISVPLSFFAAIGANARLGVLVKGSKYIETLAKIRAVCLDKTGTLTSGRLRVEEAVSLAHDSPDEIAALAAALERSSTHPVAAAVAERARGLSLPAVTDVTELAGLGLSARRGGHTVLCGGANLLKAEGIPQDGLPDAGIYLCEDGAVIGYLTLSEELASENMDLAPRLRHMGVERIMMLTGDNEKNAAAAARRYGVTEYRAGLLPADKVTAVEEVRASGLLTLFAGDGINDAPVLAAADLGASMGLGSEIANVSSDIILAGNSLAVLPDAIRVSRRAMRILRVNILFALLVKLAVLALGGLGLVTLWLAVFADIGVTILVVLNSLRVMRIKRQGLTPEARAID